MYNDAFDTNLILEWQVKVLSQKVGLVCIKNKTRKSPTACS